MKFLAVLFCLTITCVADVRTIQIPQAGWHITVDTPPLNDTLEFSQREEGEWAFRANGGRFNISGFIEKPHSPHGTHQDCYAYYWPQSKRNPMIDQKSVHYRCMEQYCVVEYSIKIPGSEIVQWNRNYYFVYHGRWIDLHISLIDPKPTDSAVFRDFERSFAYGPSGT